MTGALEKKELKIRQEGGVLIDLSGNVQVTVELLIEDDWAAPVALCKFSNLYTNAVPVLPKDIEFKLKTLIYPDIKKDIIATLDYSFLYRQIISGHRHLPEARQKIKLNHGFVKNAENLKLKKAPVTLLKAQDIKPKIYELKIGDQILSFDNTALKFETVDEATAFLRYIGDLVLKNMVISKINLNGNTLAASSYEAIKISTVQL